MRTYSLCFLALLAAGVTSGQELVGPAPSTAAAQPAAAANRYIVVFAQGTAPSARANAVAAAGAILRHNYAGMDAAAVAVPNANALEALRRSAGVLRIAPDRVIRSQAKGKPGPPPPTPLTFDTRQVIPLGVQRVGPPSTGSDGAGIGIAVVDSGIDFHHPDLDPAPDNRQNAVNAVSGGSCQDDGGHGTHVSGIIAALNNEIGVVGVAPAATLYCVKVLGSDLTGTDSDLMAGMDWVLQHHASTTPPIRVVNMSLGRPLDTANGETLANSLFHPFIQSLYNLGIVVVASAGNDPMTEIPTLVPAGFPEVLAVASTVAANGIRTCLLGGYDIAPIPADAASVFTTDGDGVTISAPGEEWTDIINLPLIGCNGLQYGTLSATLGTGGATRKLVPSLAEARGTSFSAPLVAGAAARILQKALVPLDSGASTVEGVRSWLKNNASRAGIAPVDNPLGGTFYFYSFDGVREGIAQAPK